MGFDEIRELVEQIAEENVDDIEAAKRIANRAVRKHPLFKKYVDNLVTIAVDDMVHAARHVTANAMKRSTGYWHSTPQTDYAGNRSVGSTHKVALSYSLPIGGTTIGLLTGERLRELAKTELAKANGFMFNAKLCEALALVVPVDKTVKQSVSLMRLRRIAKQVANDLRQ